MNKHTLAEMWREIVMNLTRCKHGRIQGDDCQKCPQGASISQAGRVVGFSLDGAYEVVIPPPGRMGDPHNWYVVADTPANVS